MVKSLQVRRGSHALQNHPVLVMMIAAMSGFLFVTAWVNADGDDLRPAGGDISALLNERNSRVSNRQAEARDLRQQIERLSARVSTATIAELGEAATKLYDDNAMQKLSGPGIEVVLTDAPLSAAKPGVDPQRLVVHEQDLRGFVNALWAGGARGVTLQGRRLVSTTGIKCVGNTVLLEGRTYAPPYRIKAIGDPATMIASINSQPETVTYAQYSRAYGLGRRISILSDANLPAHDGPTSLEYASADRNER